MLLLFRYFWEASCRRELAEWFDSYDVALLYWFFFLFGGDGRGFFMFGLVELYLVGVLDVENWFFGVSFFLLGDAFALY